jgi:hypothetical protein
MALNGSMNCERTNLRNVEVNGASVMKGAVLKFK